jgi:O-antigen/teichoic acid export membrane protein
LSLPRLISGTVQLLTGYGAVQLLGLARNFLVARLLTPEDFGVAATFAVTLSILEMAADLGMDKFLTQSAHGDDPRLQATVHAMTLARSVLVAGALVLAAGPVSQLFGVPQAWPAYACLGFAPLLRGLMHSDIKRVQRHFAFRQDAAAMVAAQIAALAVAVPLALILQNYWAMLWGVLAHAATQTIASHRLAERPYRVGFDPTYARAAFAFGWPLTLNGALLATTAQGDRAIVGALVGLAALGVYAVAALVVQSITGTLTAVMNSVALPWIAAAQGNLAEARRRHGLAGAAWGLALAPVFPPLIVLGDDAVALLFGEAYRPTPLLMALVAAAGLLRFWRGWLSTAAVAFGRTRVILAGNVGLLGGLALGVPAATASLGVEGVAGAMVCGEIAALTATALGCRLTGLTGLLQRARPMAFQFLGAAILTNLTASGSLGLAGDTATAAAGGALLMTTTAIATRSGREIAAGGWRRFRARQQPSPAE